MPSFFLFPIDYCSNVIYYFINVIVLLLHIVCNVPWVSVMARIPVKRVILRWLPGGMEKSVYFGSTGVVVWFMYLFWLPSTTHSLWKLQHPVLVYGVIGKPM